MSTTSDATYWLPPQSSTVAGEVDWLFHFILYVSAFFFIGITIAMAYFIVKYKRRATDEGYRGESHNDFLEILWSVVPGIILVAVFYWGFVGFLDMRVPPRNCYEIQVIAQKWSWTFVYPNGFKSPDLHVPKGVPVRCIEQSEDVLHSLFLPAMRMKQDAVPGRYTDLWFEATQAGTSDIYCAEYCGTKHSDMLAKLVVHETQADFDKWLAEASDFLARMSPEEGGKLVFQQNGCTQCHSVDGSNMTGPTLKQVFGHEVPLADGTKVTADENYIRESILEPQAKVVQGFTPVMPTYKGRLSDKEITAVIAYLKTIKD